MNRVSASKRVKKSVFLFLFYFVFPMREREEKSFALLPTSH